MENIPVKYANPPNGATLPISITQLVVTIVFLAGLIPSFAYYAYSADAEAMKTILIDIKASVEKLDDKKVDKEVYEQVMKYQNEKMDYLIELTKSIVAKFKINEKVIAVEDEK